MTALDEHRTPTTPTSPAPPAAPVAADRVARLAREAADAAQVRALTAHPDVIALRVERVRAQVDRLLWAGIVLGLAFTMVNVQSFAAAGAPTWSPGWWVAWLLDPMVSLVLLAVLRAEQVTARYQVELNAWARRTKWLTFAATYVMNTWTSWGFTDGKPFSAAGVVLHSVPPLVVFFAAETGPGLRDRLTEAVHQALVERAPRTPATTAVAAPAHQEAAEQQGPVHELVHEPTPAAVVGALAGPGGHHPALAVVPAPRPRPRPGSGRGSGVDPRVEQLVVQLRRGAELTGAAVAEQLGCSERTGRRLLRQAVDRHAEPDLAPRRETG
ncbi:hypothetical protein [Nocardioides sp.]|uniref:hypothetical protein n=1 Tax=Nocardioides sp. TaxID=35761 RepID=UPI003D0ED0AF